MVSNITTFDRSPFPFSCILSLLFILYLSSPLCSYPLPYFSTVFPLSYTSPFSFFPLSSFFLYFSFPHLIHQSFFSFSLTLPPPFSVPHYIYKNVLPSSCPNFSHVFPLSFPLYSYLLFLLLFLPLILLVSVPHSFISILFLLLPYSSSSIYFSISSPFFSYSIYSIPFHSFSYPSSPPLRLLSLPPPYPFLFLLPRSLTPFPFSTLSLSPLTSARCVRGGKKIPAER